MRFRKLMRDLWNVLISHVPSRRIRKFWLRKILGGFDSGAFICMDTHIMDPRNVFLGERSVVNAHCILDGRESRISISHDVDIGTHTHIWTLEHDPNDLSHATKGGTVTIEDHVWIASRVTILPGITIGRGAVIAAGAVVTRDVPAMSISAGIPAQVIGERENPLEYKINFNPRFR